MAIRDPNGACPQCIGDFLASHANDSPLAKAQFESFNRGTAISAAFITGVGAIGAAVEGALAWAGWGAVGARATAAGATGAAIAQTPAGQRALDTAARALPEVETVGPELAEQVAASSQIVQQGTEDIWNLGLADRGAAIEEALGGNLPPGFPTIDRFANGVATSIKSLDLRLPTYQNIGRLTSTVSGYIDRLYAFEGAARAGVAVPDPAVKVPQLAIPSGAATPTQQAALNALTEYGASNGIAVEVIPFK